MKPIRARAWQAMVRGKVEAAFFNDALRPRHRFQWSLQDIQNSFLLALLASRLFAQPIQAIE